MTAQPGVRKGKNSQLLELLVEAKNLLSLNTIERKYPVFVMLLNITLRPKTARWPR